MTPDPVYCRSVRANARSLTVVEMRELDRIDEVVLHVFVRKPSGGVAPKPIDQLRKDFGLCDEFVAQKWSMLFPRANAMERWCTDSQVSRLPSIGGNARIGPIRLRFADDRLPSVRPRTLDQAEYLRYRLTDRASVPVTLLRVEAAPASRKK
eukprot:Plantae.Rhodophyta-Rhodochaete_pulchella.ctg79026.p1 GENE.Plantae.Rhodophyta-Rhodochaete_pulchella.ctg79026~~Plantae.Rhodophyta-Rhodochaete_pulchella.ctg79026.p1  ORF type:complete len:152 (-),score=8.95 Plantae.Rhodophyta-Rhodochaete_pulchella.ctg79026:250-705(-)